MEIELCGGLDDIKEPLADIIQVEFVPRVDDIIYYKNKRYKAYQIIIDYDYNKISVYVKDCIK